MDGCAPKSILEEIKLYYFAWIRTVDRPVCSLVDAGYAIATLHALMVNVNLKMKWNDIMGYLEVKGRTEKSQENHSWGRRSYG